MGLYYEKTKEYFKVNQKDVKKTIGNITEEIKTHRINQAQRLILDGELDSTEYKEIKIKYDSLISGLGKEQVNLELTDTDYIRYVKYNFVLLKNIDQYYAKAELDVKQQFIGSIYPEKLTFENNAF